MQRLSPLEITTQSLKGTRWRLRRQGTLEKLRSPWVKVEHTLTGKGAAIKGCRWNSETELSRAVKKLREIHQRDLREGRETPLTDVRAELLPLFADNVTNGGKRRQTWGFVSELVLSWIAPGGQKARDRAPFACFREDSYFGRHFDPDATASTEELRRYCLHTTESLNLWHEDPASPLVPRDYNGRSFEQAVQLVNRLNKFEVGCATDSLCAELKKLRQRGGKRKAAKPRFNPRDEDIEIWVKQLEVMGWHLHAWAFAFMATYGLRNHEIWHVVKFPGEIARVPDAIQVANFEDSSDGRGQVKTGARVALACKPEWIKLFGLDDLERNREMIEQLRSRWKIKTATRDADGVEVVVNNAQLGVNVCHWLNHKGNADREVPVKLFGYYRPPSIGGKMNKEKKGLCTPYDLRHAWALRALRLTTWSTALKASSMGHAESTHQGRYLVGLKIEDKIDNVAALLELDEGRESVEVTKTPATKQTVDLEELEALRALVAKQKKALDALLG